MNEELDQIEKNNTWELVPRPHDKNFMKLDLFVKGMLNKKVYTLTKKLRQ